MYRVPEANSNVPPAAGRQRFVQVHIRHRQHFDYTVLVAMLIFWL